MALVALRVGGDPAAWAALGLRVTSEAADVSTAMVGGVRLDLVGGEPGVHGWVLSAPEAGAPSGPDTIDGIPTSYEPLPEVDAPAPTLGAGARPEEGHELRVVGFDHVVVNTSSLDRTCGAIEAATGAPLKRIREVGTIRQGFHRLGPVVVEVVESPQVTADTATLWGFVWNVDDLHAVCDRLGPDLIAPAKPAVQVGRFIATVRPAAGLGVPLALMTPNPPRPVG